MTSTEGKGGNHAGCSRNVACRWCPSVYSSLIWTTLKSLDPGGILWSRFLLFKEGYLVEMPTLLMFLMFTVVFSNGVVKLSEISVGDLACG